MKPVIAIVGRPNAGKSTFFNRITRSKDALVDDFAGVTRDRHYGSVTWDDVACSVIDTGGFYFSDKGEFSQKTHGQVRCAIEDADAIIVLFDGAQGVTPFDRDMVELLRSAEVPVYYTVNKIDNAGREENIYDFYNLGIETIYSISAEHNLGINTLMDNVVAAFPAGKSDAAPDEPIRVGIVGRPNVGKSSLINRILGEERVIVSEVPGTTRDAIDTPCEVNGRNYLLIDTAGIRRKARVKHKLEKYAVIKAIDSLDRCDVALIVIDAADGLSEQDVKIAGYAYEKGCACIFLLNKWDLVEKNDKTFAAYKDSIRHEAKYLHFAPLLTISAKTGRRVPKIFEFIDAVYRQYTHRVATGPLNRIVTAATEQTEPPLFRGRRLKFFYATQTGVKPPTFVCFVNHPEGVHFSYRRYLVNQLRAATGIDLVPIRLYLRKRSEAENRPRRPKKAAKRK
ncbi:MAG: ribosome biogenesis GTPase Der [Thermodesulfobacteriota bacterium]